MPSEKLLLFPTDFSECSQAALAYATSLASDLKAGMLIVHVEDRTLAYGDVDYGPEGDGERAREMLAEVIPNQAVRYEHRLAKGHPARTIVQLAKDEHADLIVMGTHGRTGVKRVLLGSVAEFVLRHAPCPVLTVKVPHPDETQG